MASIVYSEFSGGVDLSRPANIQDANRFRELRNAYVTPGKAVRKRPGARYVWSWGPGVRGLFTGPGCLTGFWGGANPQVQAITSVPFVQDSARYRTMRLDYAGSIPGNPGDRIDRVHAAFLVADSLYVVAATDVGVRHFFGKPTDLTANRIEDANCPNGTTAIPIASKVFAGDPSGVVRFSKTDDPRDWTAEDDAGFLPTNRKTRSSNTIAALGEFDGRLVVSTGDAAQLWDVDPDPAEMRFYKTIAVGQVAGDTGANVGADLFFLSPSGVRSIVLNAQNANAMDLDVGVPVDRLATQFTTRALARFFPSLGQFWLIEGARALVYSFSRTAKVYAWSEYVFPWEIAGAVDFEGTAYLRSADGDIYRLDPDYAYDDDARAAVAALGSDRDPYAWADEMPAEGRAAPRVRVITPFFDFKSPAALKQIHAMDVVATRGARAGRFEITHRFRSDTGSEVFEAGPIDLSMLPDDSRPQGWIPVGLMAPSVAAVIEHEAPESFELSALIYHFDNLGVAG